MFPLGGAPAYGSMGGKPLGKPIAEIDTVSKASDLVGYWRFGN